YDGVSGGAADGMEWGIVCSDNTPINNGMTFATANAAEWTAPEQMTWIAQPHLVSVGPAGWIAMVGLVGQAGDTGFSSHNVAIVLSTDGGDSWQVPHLVAEVDGLHGGTDD